jgi:hypothetical protein
MLTPAYNQCTKALHVNIAWTHRPDSNLRLRIAASCLAGWVIQFSFKALQIHPWSTAILPRSPHIQPVAKPQGHIQRSNWCDWYPCRDSFVTGLPSRARTRTIRSRIFDARNPRRPGIVNQWYCAGLCFTRCTANENAQAAKLLGWVTLCWDVQCRRLKG